MNWHEGRDKAEELALKALELDGNLSEAYTVLGTLYDYFDWEWEKAENAFQHALALNPNYSTAHKYYAEHLSIIGQHEKARMHLNRAIKLDPLSFVVRYTSAQFYYHQGHFKETLRELDICDEIQKGHRWIYRYRHFCYWQMGQEDKAYEAYRALLSQNPIFDLEIADQIFDGKGIKAVMEWRVEKEIAVAEEHTGYYSDIARDLAMLGRYEEALPWLEKAFQLHQNQYIGFNLHFKALHDQPRFQAILEGMGLGE